MALVKKIISNVDKDVEKLELSNTAAKNVKWCNVLKNNLQFLKKLNIELRYNLANPLPRHIHERTETYVHTNTH